MYFVYLNLPCLPKELIADLSDIMSRPNNFLGRSENYTLHSILNQRLYNEITNIFPFKIKASYHVLKKHVVIHKDINRVDAFNYIIEAGNATTTFYDNDKKTILFEKNIEPLRWHYLNVSKFHGVTNIERVRLAITVTPLVEDPLKFLSSFIDLKN